MVEDLRKKFKQVAEKIDKSNVKTLVASIGKQSLGKSYFLNQVFSCELPHKGSMLVGRGTFEFQYLDLGDFHLLDMEGFESNSTSQIKDVFNFYLAMCNSNVILFHISHQDLENRVFIKNFAYCYYQCFSPTTKTCFHYKKELPKIIILVRDPRFDEPSEATEKAYDRLIKDFEKEVNELASGFLNEFISIVRETDIKENPGKREIINEHMDMFKEFKFGFKIEAHFVIYFQREMFGREKIIQYYELVVNENNEYDIEKSEFKTLKDKIISYNSEKENSDKKQCLDSNECGFEIDDEILNELELIVSKQREFLSDTNQREEIILFSKLKEDDFLFENGKLNKIAEKFDEMCKNLNEYIERIDKVDEEEPINDKELRKNKANEKIKCLKELIDEINKIEINKKKSEIQYPIIQQDDFIIKKVILDNLEQFTSKQKTYKSENSKNDCSMQLEELKNYYIFGSESISNISKQPFFTKNKFLDNLNQLINNQSKILHNLKFLEDKIHVNLKEDYLYFKESILNELEQPFFKRNKILDNLNQFISKQSEILNKLKPLVDKINAYKSKFKQKEEHNKIIEDILDELEHFLKQKDIFSKIQSFICKQKETFNIFEQVFSIKEEISNKLEQYAKKQQEYQIKIAKKRNNQISYINQFPCLQKTNYKNREKTFYKLENLVLEQKALQNSASSMVEKIYTEIKFDIFKSVENFDGQVLFLQKYYKIKTEIDSIIQNNSEFIKSLIIHAASGSLNNQDVNQIKSKQSESKQKFDEICYKLKLNSYKERIFNYFRMQAMNSFQTYFELNENRTDSISYTAIFSIINFDNQELINSHLFTIQKQMLLYESLCFYDLEWKSILKVIFADKFNFFDVVIKLTCKSIENLKLMISDKSEFINQAKKIRQRLKKKHLKTFLKLFDGYLGIKQKKYKKFLRLFLKLIKAEVNIYSSELSEARTEKIFIIQHYINKRYPLYSAMIPSISGLMVGTPSLLTKLKIKLTRIKNNIFELFSRNQANVLSDSIANTSNDVILQFDYDDHMETKYFITHTEEINGELSGKFEYKKGRSNYSTKFHKNNDNAYSALIIVYIKALLKNDIIELE